jgi:DNA-binding GntR family transcriptional regulator
MSTTIQIDTTHGHRRNSLVQSLLSDVISGEFQAGERLVTQDLAERYGVSHTPIREALITLAGMGLVELVPNKGAIARQVSTNEVLEVEASRLACGRIDPDDLRDLSKRLSAIKELKEPSEVTITEARILDSRLHDLISANCGNHFLTLEIDRLKLLFRAFRDAAWEHDQAKNDYRRLAQEAEEHLRIVDALLKQKPKEASRAMVAHLQSGLKYWSRAIPQFKSERSQANTKKKTPRKESR